MKNKHLRITQSFLLEKTFEITESKLDDHPSVNHILFKGKSEAEFYPSNAINLILCLKIPKFGTTWNSCSVLDFGVYA